jgi:hypothetical protein
LPAGFRRREEARAGKKRAGERGDLAVERGVGVLRIRRRTRREQALHFAGELLARFGSRRELPFAEERTDWNDAGRRRQSGSV